MGKRTMVDREWQDCGECEIAHTEAECPGCPVGRRLTAAESKLRQVELFRITLEEGNSFMLEHQMNRLAAAGWRYLSMTTGYSQDADGGCPAYTALFVNPDYKVEDHRHALEHRDGLMMAFQKIRFEWNRKYTEYCRSVEAL